MHQSPQAGLGGIAGRNLGRGLQRIQPPNRHLIGSGKHRKAVHRGRLELVFVVEGLQKTDIGGMQVTEKKHDGVRWCGHLLVFCEKGKALGRDIGGNRVHTRRVDVGGRLQSSGRPVHRQSFQIVSCPVAEVHLDGPTLTGEPDLFGLSALGRCHDPVDQTVLIPRDHTRAFTFVGRGQLITHQRVEQGGLTSFDPAGNRHSEWFVETFGRYLQQAQRSLIAVSTLSGFDQSRYPPNQGRRAGLI